MGRSDEKTSDCASGLRGSLTARPCADSELARIHAGHPAGLLSAHSPTHNGIRRLRQSGLNGNSNGNGCRCCVVASAVASTVAVALAVALPVPVGERRSKGHVSGTREGSRGFGCQAMDRFSAVPDRS